MRLTGMERTAKANLFMANRSLELLSALLTSETNTLVFVGAEVGGRFGAMLVQFINLLAYF